MSQFKLADHAHGAAWACNQNRTSNEETEKQKQVCSEKAATERVCTAFYKQATITVTAAMKNVLIQVIRNTMNAIQRCCGVFGSLSLAVSKT